MRWSMVRGGLVAGAVLTGAWIAGCGSGDSETSETPGTGGQTQEDAAAGSGGSSGTSGSGGAAGTAGAAGSAGTAGVAGAAGNAGAAGTAGTAGNAGEAGAAGTAGGAGTAGSAGDAGSAGSAGGSTCVDKCTENNSQCVGAQVQTCEKQSNGCTEWAAPEDCANQKACNAGKCPTCTDACTYGNTQCAGAQIQQCVTGTDGCTVWGTATDCPFGKACTGGTCPQCVDKCVVNTTQCLGVQVQTCAVQSNGCTDWEAPENCANGKSCTQGACPTCTDQCTANNTQCNGTQIQTCAIQSNGCAGWEQPVNCPNGKSCVNGVCPTCTDQCTDGATKCNGSQIQTCAVQGNGCTDWGAAQDCPSSGVCQGTPAACVAACTVGELRCNGNLLEVCNASHQWMTQQVCAQSCDAQAKACTGATTCVAGTRRCSGLQTQVCNSTGTAWLNVQSCLVACDQGLCTGACTPGEKRCNGNTTETCNGTGTAWTQDQTCSTFCVKGTCAKPTLTIDADANATLDGEHVYDGDVVLKNASVLTVPSGKLIIRAKNVVIDASSKIVVQPTGDEPRGKGADGGSASCTNCCTATTTLNATGGGYGTSGAGLSKSISCYSYYCGTNYCTASRAGGSVYAIADTEVVTGSPGGACSGTPGGKGGGYLAIYAETITIQAGGQITAIGQAGTNCSGGGSGGEVFLRATKDLSVAGSISTAGGPGGSSGGGNGGDGVIKMLYGDAKTLTGSTVGSVFSSFMPPDDLSSSTHPRQDRWYNDGYTSVDIAWSKPFIASAGYYEKLNTTYGFVPAFANATFQSSESIVYQSTSLVPGSNHMHIATLGPFSTLGTVENRFTVKVNATAPSITSDTHASQTTWYANTAPHFLWTLPQADVNTSNFYWVFDPYYETIPTAADNKIPMDLVTPQNSKQILLPGKTNGIWFFHLISQDTMGYLTKSAARFRVQIGTDPGKGSVSGMVTDATTSAFISGVQITLNRGVQDTTTGSNGDYAFANTVFAQSYEVRARKAGYKDATQTVNVTAGVTSTVNLSMQQQ